MDHVLKGVKAVNIFQIGDKVVYPMYGAGIIEGMEEKDILGKKENYYIIQIPVGNLKIMISVDKADHMGVREIAAAHEVTQMMNNVGAKHIIMPENWNQRYKENMEKIKTGDLSNVAEVVRNLMLREKEKGLSSAEKKMLTNAKQILISELVLAHDIEKDRAEKLVWEALC